jgi:small subunit ribosomal protein S8
MLTDPVADMLTRIRNGAQARKATVDIPWSRHKEAIAKVLVEEGYLESAAGTADPGAKRMLRVGIRYDERRQPVMNGVKRVSRPSLRVYVGAGEIPAIRRGLGVNVLSTPKGVLADREARKQGVGGELLCTVW